MQCVIKGGGGLFNIDTHFRYRIFSSGILIQVFPCGIFILQHAHALEVLEDKLVEGAKALDVGSGSGYLTACFARMVSGRCLYINFYSYIHYTRCIQVLRSLRTF